MMSKGSKEALTVLFITHVTQVERVKSQKWCLWLLHNTVYRVMLLILLLMSKGSKVYNTMYCTLYTVPLTPPRWKVIYLKAFCLVGLAVYHQSVRGGSFVNFLGLVNYKGDCRQDPQPIPNS